MNLNRFTDKEIDEVAQALGVSFTPADREALLSGQYTSLIDGLPDGESQRSGKIRLEKDARTKEIRVNFYFRKESLFIPDVLFGRRLSEEERQRMKNGELLRFSYKGDNIYLQVDRELNSVIVKSDRDLNIPAVIGNYNDFPGYSLTDGDKELLANGGVLPPKVLKGEQGFFLARFSMTNDMKGYSFQDYESIPDGTVVDYLKKYNSAGLELGSDGKAEIKETELDRGNAVADVAEKGFENPTLENEIKDKDKMNLANIDVDLLPEFLQHSYGLYESAWEEAMSMRASGLCHPDDIQEQVNEARERYKEFREQLREYIDLKSGNDISFKRDVDKEKALDYLHHSAPIAEALSNSRLDSATNIVKDFDKELYDALDRRDFEKLNELANSGYKPADEQISKIESLPGISDADKTAIRTIFGIEAKETGESRIVRKDMTKGNVVLNKKEKEQRRSGGEKEKIGNVICQIFRE